LHTDDEERQGLQYTDWYLTANEERPSEVLYTGEG